MIRPTMPKVCTTIPALLVGILIAACAGGGSGGGGPQPMPQPQPQPQPQPPAPIAPAGHDTGLTGSIDQPARAAFGSEPVQTATGGGPWFDKSGGSATFPVLVSSLTAGAGGISAVTPNQGAAATFGTEGAFTTLRLQVPALNMDHTFSLLTGALVAQGALLNGAGTGDWITSGLSYVLMGEWGALYDGPNSNLTRFVFGYETPALAMPNTGTATFTGGTYATVLKPVDGKIYDATVSGGAEFSVDFASGAITGIFHHMEQYTGGTPLPWNDVSVTASITGGNRLRGSTSATTAPDTMMGLSGSATGTIDGALYGPNAENLGAIWSLSDGKGSALGSVTAGR